MAGIETAVTNGQELVQVIVDLGRSLGLEVTEQVQVGRRLWGAVRKIDVVLIHPETRKTLGIECKCQAVKGTAEEKIPSTIQDIGAWPIPGIVVFAGPGFTDNIRNYLLASGKAVALEDVLPWLSLFFGLRLSQVASSDPQLALRLGTRAGPRRSATRGEEPSGKKAAR
jgi:hypothetical protein